MLIDSSHKKWFIITLVLAAAALGIYLYLSHNTPGGLTGGSTVGLWYGIVGTAMMLFAGFLSALRKLPPWKIFSRRVWLKGHIWFGLLSFLVILCHSGFRWGGPLEVFLWLTFGVVTLTGIFGLILQQILPQALTTRVTSEAPYEQIPHLCQLMRRKADTLMETIWNTDIQVSQTNLAGDSIYGMGAKFQFFQFYEKHVRPFLERGSHGSGRLANPLQSEASFASLRSLPGLKEFQEQISQLETFCDERRQLEAQERMQYWLHTWLLLHVPLCVLMLVLGVLHVFTALYY